MLPFFPFKIDFIWKIWELQTGHGRDYQLKGKPAAFRNYQTNSYSSLVPIRHTVARSKQLMLQRRLFLMHA